MPHTQVTTLLTIVVGLLIGCSAPESNRSSNSTKTIPETVAPSCKTPEGGGEKVCTCKEGYELDGDICRFIDECKKTVNGGCDPNATCKAKIGGRTCTCKTGYTGDGETCTTTSTGCGSCDPNATCTNNTCVCKTGYVGDGKTCFESNSPCSVNNGGCSPDAFCTPTSASTVQCTCKPGYTGDGKTCTANNPCAMNNGGCDVNATCSVGAGNTAQCTCKTGYTGNGFTCTPTSTRTIGSDCATPGAQSNCARGQICVSFGDVNYCSKTDCTSDDDCGTSNGNQNICYPFKDVNACLRGCDPNDITSCGRPELACYSVTQDDSVGVCFPRCESDLDCTYGSFCNQTSGVCDSTPCGANNTCSNANEVCYVRTVDGTQVKSCVPKCNLTGCRPGRTCNSTTRVCDPIIRQAYETCGEDIGACVMGTECLSLGNGTYSTCIKENCTTNASCPTSPYGTTICQKGSSNGQSFSLCVLPCDPNATVSNCPPDTACDYQFPASANPNPSGTVFCGGDQL